MVEPSLLMTGLLGCAVQRFSTLPKVLDLKKHNFLMIPVKTNGKHHYILCPCSREGEVQAAALEASSIVPALPDYPSPPTMTSREEGIYWSTAIGRAALRSFLSESMLLLTPPPLPASAVGRAPNIVYFHDLQLALNALYNNTVFQLLHGAEVSDNNILYEIGFVDIGHRKEIVSALEIPCMCASSDCQRLGSATSQTLQACSRCR